jgi:NAD(P)H dehydrogenase (quinone)
MKHAVIVAHPDSASFNLAVAQAYCDAVRARGDDANLRDLYRLGFDPRLQAHELPRLEGFEAGEDVRAERAAITDADVFAFVYPLWFNAPPAMIKGYIERVFGMGFGYGPQHDGGNVPLLGGRRMITFSSSGAPMEWVRQEGAWAALRNLFDDHVAAVCGMTCLDHVHFGGVTRWIRDDVVQDCLQQVRDTVVRLF